MLTEFGMLPMKSKNLSNSLALASTSPRRRELLVALGFKLTLLDPNIDESIKPGESPEDLALRLGKEKALAVAHLTELPVIAADTIVVVDEEILGKPDDLSHARQMIQKLSGREHLVITGYAVLYQNKLINNWATTKLVFRDLSEHEIEAYLETGEWAGKSGACTLQGSSGPFVDHMTGSFTNVLGLPLTEILAALEKVVTPAGFEPALTT